MEQETFLLSTYHHYYQEFNIYQGGLARSHQNNVYTIVIDNSIYRYC